MNSFITNCCLAGISDWIIAANMSESPPAGLLRCFSGLNIGTPGSVYDDAPFSCGKALSLGKPVGLLIRASDDQADSLAFSVEYARRHALPLLVLLSGNCKIAQSCHPFEISSPSSFDSWDFRSPLVIGFGDETLCEQDVNKSRFADFTPRPAPSPRFPRPNVGDLAVKLRNDYYKGVLIMAGETHPDDFEPALWLIDTLNAPVIADPRSGLREEIGDNLIHDEESVFSRLFPDMVIRLGGIPHSPLWKELENQPGTSVFSLTRSGINSLNRESVLIESPLDSILKALGEVAPAGDPLAFMPVSRKRQGLIEELIMSCSESAQSLLYAVSQFTCLADAFFLSGSDLLSVWKDCAQTTLPVNRVFGNAEPLTPLSELSLFAGCTYGLNETWFIGESKLFTPEFIQSMPEPEEGQKRVFVSAHLLGNTEEVTQDIPDHITHIQIRSSFDMDKLDAMDEPGCYLIEIIPDEHQTSTFNQQLANRS